MKNNKAKLYEKLTENKVKCTACNHYCKISTGKTGICGVRKNIEGELYLLVDQRPLSVNIDPIEKKPLYHFKPQTKILSIGTVGCNFRCSFCQNWQMSQGIKDMKDPEALIEKHSKKYSAEDLVNYCVENNIPSIAYTYNEPAIFIEYALDIMKLAHKKSVKNVFVSNGFESDESLKELLPYLDAINVDLKSFSDNFYKKLCGGELQPVLDNIKKYYKSKNVWLEVTTLVIPDENDSTAELRNIAKFIKSVSADIPWHISRFSPAYKMLKQEVTSMEKLLEAYEIGKEVGLKYVYIGNIRDNRYSATYCPGCDAELIERGWHSVTNKVENNQCPECGTKIQGHWT